MKKIILLIVSILIIFLICLYIYKPNFQKPKQTKDNNTINKPKKEEETDIISEYADNNPIIIGLYKNYRNGTNRKLITSYESKWQYHQDISSFEVYYTKDEEIPNTNQIKLFDKYQNNYENINNYRIGYQIEFTTSKNTINKTILSPKDTNEFYDYLEVYLYDDYHRNGGWYSHTTEEEFNENTLLTSIKLTAGKNINEITSDIILTAFTYDEDDFDELGNYKGISKYTITVKKVIS